MRQRWFRRSSAAFGGCFSDLDLIDGEFSELFLDPMLADDRRISGQTRYLMGIDWKLLDGLKGDHAKITAPVLLVWGADDPVFPVEEARAMVPQLANCVGFVTIEGGKLFVHEEMPRQVLPPVLDFLIDEQRTRGVIAAPSSARQPGRLTMAGPHPILDAGGTAVLLILLGVFIAPTLGWLGMEATVGRSSKGSFELEMLIMSALVCADPANIPNRSAYQALWRSGHSRQP